MNTSCAKTLGSEVSVEYRARSLASATLCSVACILVFAANNFAIWPIAASSPAGVSQFLVLACLGAAGAQTAILAVWCALAPVGFVKRLTAGVLTGSVLFGASALGFALFSGHGELRHATWDTARVFGVLLCLPLVVIAIQAPVWCAKHWLGWRVMPPSDCSAQMSRRSLGIRDLLVVVGVVAMALGAVRLAASLNRCAPSSLSVPLAAGITVPIAIGAIGVAAFSLLTTIPVVLATLRTRRMWPAFPAVLLLDVAITIGLIALFVAVAPPLPNARWKYYLLFATMPATFFAVLTGVMLLVRRVGGRLLCGQRQEEASH